MRGQFWDLLDVGPQTGPDQGSEAEANETGEPAEEEVLSMFAEIMEEETPQQACGESAVQSQMNLIASF